MSMDFGQAIAALHAIANGNVGAPQPTPSFQWANPAPANVFSGGGGGGGHGGGWGSGWGFVGNLLQTPLSVVSSTTSEIGRGLDKLLGNSGIARYALSGLADLPHQNDKAPSLSDWANQITNPSQRITPNDQLFGNQAKGMGDTVFSQVKSPFLRIPADIALGAAEDPLTYVASGAGSAAEVSSAVRAATITKATDAAEALAAADHVAQGAAATGDALKGAQALEAYKNADPVAKILADGADAASRAARLGIAGLKPEEAAHYLTAADGSQLASRGLQFLGKPIPLTDAAPATKFGDLWAQGKALAGDAFHASPLDGMFGGADQALKSAARGSDAKAAFEAAMTLGEKQMGRNLASSLEETMRQGGATALRGLSPQERQSLFAAFGENPDLSGLTPKAQQAAQQLSDQMAAIRSQANDAGVSLGNQENYLPHTMDPADRAALQKAGLLDAAAKFGGFKSFAENARTLVPDAKGLYHFAGQTFSASNEAELRQAISDIAKQTLTDKLGPKAAAKLGGFFDPSIESTLGRYYNSISNRISLANAAKNLYAGGIGNSEPAAIDAIKQLKGALPKNASPDLSAAQKASAALGEIVGQPTTHAATDASGAAEQAVQAHADLIDQFQKARQGIAASLAGNDVVGAREALGQALKTALPPSNGIEDAQQQALALEHAVGQHFPEGPGGVPFADTAAIKSTLGNIADNLKQRALDLNQQAEQSYATTANGALAGAAAEHVNQYGLVDKLTAQTPEQTAQHVDQLQHNLDLVQNAVQSGVVKGAKRGASAENYINASTDELNWAKVRAATADPNIQRAAAYAEAASHIEANIAADGGKVLDASTKLASLPDAVINKLSQGLRDGASVELHSGIGTPQKIADWLVQSERYTHPDALKPILSKIDQLIGYTKNWELMYPGFPIKMFIGHGFNAFGPGGAEVASYADYFRLLKNAADLAPEDAARLNQVRQLIGKNVVTGEGDLARASSLLEDKSWNPLSRNFVPMAKMRQVTSDMQDFLRGGFVNDQLLKGASPVEATQSLNRYLFDYQDLSKFEQGLRHVVPFYTFTRKNLPLMVETLVKDPKWFSRYFEAKQAIEQQSSPDGSVPGYFDSLGAIRLPFQSGGGHMYLTPNLPMNDLMRWGQSPKNDLMQGLSMISPVFKTPLEYWAKKQFFANLPLSDNKFSAVPEGLSFLSPLLNKIGITDQASNGKYMISERNLYALQQMLPIITQIRRAAPNNPTDQARHVASLFSLTGVPMRTNTQQQQQNAALVPKYNQKSATTRQRALEKAALALGG